MSTFDDILHLEKFADGNQTWGAGYRQTMDVLGEVVAPDRVYHVSPNFSDGQLHNSSATDRRHFETIQGAITAAESVGYGTQGYTVLIYPGDSNGEYRENLTIVDPVRLVGMAGSQGWTGGIKLRGVNTVQSPIITVNPPDSTFGRYLFQNLTFDNCYDQATTADVDIAKAYAVDVTPQATLGGSSNIFDFRNCVARMQTWGTNNLWTRGIWLQGWTSSVFYNCQMEGLAYAGGANNGGVRRLIDVDGWNSATFYSTAWIQRSEFANYCTPPTAGKWLVSCDKYASAVMSWASYSDTGANATRNGGTGSNAFIGFTSGQEVTYRNIFSTDLVVL